MSEKPGVLILSGFLGAGKTMLLMQIVPYLRQKHGEDYSVAIIENEIGAAAVDAGIIGQAGYSVTNMLSGCVCCTLVGELVPTLRSIEGDLAPNLVILEATGMAEPSGMMKAITEYAGNEVRLLTIIDSVRWPRIAVPLHNLLSSQIAPAAALCVNKTDKVSPDEANAVLADVREMNPTAAVALGSAAESLSAECLEALLGGIDGRA